MFTTYIRRLRESLGLSLRDVAAKSGVSHTYIMLLETGKVVNPSVDRLAALARVYGVTTYDLICRAYPDAMNTMNWEDIRRSLIALGYTAQEADERLRELRAHPPSKRGKKDSNHMAATSELACAAS